jgi:opacity protein-like surface antigen
VKRLLTALVPALALVPATAFSADAQPVPAPAPAAAPAAPPPAAPAVKPPHRSESLDFVRARTGFTVASGDFQGDTLFAHTQTRDIEGTGTNFYGDALTASLAYGITDWLTAKAFLPLLVRVDPDPGSIESGIGDLGLEAKVLLKKDASPLGFVPLVDFSAGLNVTFPTGDEDKGLGAGDAVFRPYAAASYWFQETFGVHGSAVLRFEEGERPEHTVQAFAEIIPFGPALSLLGGFEMHRVGGDPAAWAFIPGAEYRITERISAGLGVPIGISDKAEDFGILANAQLMF